VRQALTAAVTGPFFPDWEFATLFGLDRDEVRAVLAAWPETDDPTAQLTAVTNALNNLLGYPHGLDRRWGDYLSVDRNRLQGLLHTIRQAAGLEGRVERAGGAMLEDDAGHRGSTADYFLVTVARGPAWDHGRRRREQAGWDEHAAFMDALAAEGVVVLGGPVGEGDGDDVLLVVAVDDEATIRARLAADPWAGSILTIDAVRPWSVWLRGPGR